MAGMLYLPRLFVYHTKCKKKSESSELLKTMERRLLKIIINPAMIASFIFGILLISHDTTYYMKSGWLHIKLLFILLLTILHIHYARTVRLFALDNNTKSEKYYRIINECPALIMIAIVILAIIKPF